IHALDALENVLTITPLPSGWTLNYEDTTSVAPAGLPAIPGYEILGELGRGGMGVVYRARNLGMGRIEALKMLRVPSAKLAERFRLEIRAAAQGDSPNVVQIFSEGTHNGQQYFTMQFVEGGTLTQHRGEYTKNANASARLLAKVARAVQTL